VKRTADLTCFGNYVVQSSASRTLNKITRPPSAEALGYFHSVRFADVEMTFAARPISNDPIDESVGYFQSSTGGLMRFQYFTNSNLSRMLMPGLL
jgi:hypothetical protein